MVSSPATSETGVHAAGGTKSEHFEPARVRKLNEKQFSYAVSVSLPEIWRSVIVVVE
jgi:hypothetical protein